jgi:hypothetical protein
MPFGEGNCIWSGGPTGGDTPLIYTWSTADFGTIQVDTTYNTQDTVGWYDPYIPPDIYVNETMFLTVTDQKGSSGSNSLYEAGYECPGGDGDNVKKKGGTITKTDSGGVPSSSGAAQP